MEEFDRVNRKFRNIAFVIIIIAIILLIIWLILFELIGEKEFQVLLAIVIGLFLAGLLFLTRIQYVIWTSKKFSNKIHTDKIKSLS
jgi:amino acid transporter